MVKVKFEDLSGWLKFGAISSIALGLFYTTILLIGFIVGILGIVLA